jgi:NADH-quinone oxidoreductase subunit L
MLTILLLTIVGAPALGAVGAIVMTSFTKGRCGVLGAGMPVVVATLCSFICSLKLWSDNLVGRAMVLSPWIDAGLFGVNLELAVDRLSICMLLIITGIGSLIQLYSIGYMREDAGKGRYFAYLGLFIFFMAILVTGANLPVVFIGWEGVGLSSYLLISFWFENESFKRAGEKAFIVNRLGDLGVLLALACLAVFAGASGVDRLNIWDFETLRGLMLSATFDVHQMRLLHWSLIGILFAVTAKSAQIPLFVWLPDAMAGPTPVSALIHAATMVTAGVYLICRMGFLCSVAPELMLMMAVIGAVTALMAALIAMTQVDIKKVLAYSTVSQLGFMVVAASCGLYGIALFHVVTHAFFKACLFLGSGTVIHACEGEQDMQSFGGMAKVVPVTAVCFTVGALALAGVFPFSGFYSKYQITHALAHSPLVHTFHSLSGQGVALGISPDSILSIIEKTLLVTSCLTAFYITRVVLLTFMGTYRGSNHVHDGDGGFEMAAPVLLLGIGSLVMGGLGSMIPEYVGLGDAASAVKFDSMESFLLLNDLPGLLLKSVIALVGIVGAISVYVLGGYQKLYKASFPLLILAPLSREKFLWDEVYELFFVAPFKNISSWLQRTGEPFLLDGIVNGIWMSVVALGQGVVALQTGQIRTYALGLFSLLLGLLLFYMVL